VVDCQAVRAARLASDRGDETPPGVEEHLQSCIACAQALARVQAMDEALAALAKETLPPPPFALVEGPARAAARGRRRRRVVRRALPLALAFASAVVLTVGMTRFARRHDDKLAASGDVLDASRGVAHATLVDGASVTLTAGRAFLDVSEHRHARVRLEAGAIFFGVPHLGPGETFVLATEEAEVHVRGTRFNVARMGQETQVTVTEGSVEVRPRIGSAFGAPLLLAKGGTARFDGQAQHRQQARTAALAALDQPTDGQAADRIKAWLDTAPPAEEAAEAHALLAWKQLRDGDRSGALRSYRRALSLLPPAAAPLWADNACAQLAVLVEREAPSESAAAWQAYLVRFPTGVHAARARDRLAREARGNR
jgi:ferric-dicitrate binding protein FerR (iron transport regulator)